MFPSSSSPGAINIVADPAGHLTRQPLGKKHKELMANRAKNAPRALTLDLSCHQVFAAGRRHVAIRGPFAELEEEIVHDHKDFW